MNRLFITTLFLSGTFCVSAQRISVEDYIEQYKNIAISEMKRSGVPASITLAQGILESESGNSELVKKSNNHFGIKCKSSWEGESVSHDDDASGECFRAYTNAEDSYKDHSDFLRKNQRYGSLFSLDPADYTGWATGLKKAGYATNPRYPELLIKYVEQYNLQQYSLAVLNELPKMDIAKINDRDDKSLPDEIKNESGKALNENLLTAADPDKVITVNKTKCVFVEKGTSLLAIAAKYDISLNRLMEFNELTSEGILGKDQHVFLHKKQKAGDKEYYITQPGETLYDIAQKNGIQLKALMGYNNLKDGEVIHTNTKVYLQPGLKSATNNSEKIKPQTHLVAAKEGLYAIAKMYKVSVQQLKEWNKLDTDNLKVGQEIIVSK